MLDLWVYVLGCGHIAVVNPGPLFVEFRPLQPCSQWAGGVGSDDSRPAPPSLRAPDATTVAHRTDRRQSHTRLIPLISRPETASNSVTSGPA